MSLIRILTVGDVVGTAATEKLSSVLFPLKSEYRADFVIVNGENAAPGNGIDVPSAKNMLYAGADVITTGNHVWQKKDMRKDRSLLFWIWDAVWDACSRYMQRRWMKLRQQNRMKHAGRLQWMQLQK